MAKRKRLTLPEGLSAAPTAPLETKGFVNGWQGSPSRTAPISQMANDAASRAALEELASALHSARSEGRMVVAIPLAQIDAAYLVRDRIALQDEDMQALTTSIETRGQQTPLEVEDLGEGRYGLISGWRRLHALHKLYDQTGSDRFAQALCLIRAPEQSADAYLAMVEENEIRASISYYERARIAARATAQGVFESEKKALQGLFVSVSYAKRSKIRSFMSLYAAFDDVLRFPAMLGERTGLAMAAALQSDPCFAENLRAALTRAAPETAPSEQAVIAQVLAAPIVAKTEPEPQVRDVTEPTDPVTVTRRGGKLILSGPGVDDDFEALLRDWIAAQLG